MSKSDYWVVVFKLLNYHFQMMKQGKMTNEDDVSASKLGINQPYLLDVYRNLFEDGYLTGARVVIDYSDMPYFEDYSSVRITTKGIEYLQENTKMKQVYNFLKEFKEWIPGL
ncbi:hypothetical protein JXA27_08055 [Aerococcaceae bacterium zg-B36]|uniref:YjcQ family protein n=1 Tax=Aerococcaceae bacterium zg-252 TaxID=2796928 RepID=UPI001BD80B72|nr:hypothetical protein [Aerococcaceae bacterium zg-B36]